MMQRKVQVTISAGLATGLLGLGAAIAWAQPAEPAARPAPFAGQAAAPAAPVGQAASAADPVAAGAAADRVAAAPAANPAAAKASPTDPATAKTDKAAVAKPGTPAPGAALPPGTSIKVERAANGAKLFRITEGMLVEGQMQRPNAFLVLQRATVDYDYEALSESFLPRILSATREKPF